MSQRRAKRARRHVRQLAAIVAKHGPAKDGQWSDDVWLEVFYTPRERRRAEAVVAHKAPKNSQPSTTPVTE